jgi:hypothetical protein
VTDTSYIGKFIFWALPKLAHRQVTPMLTATIRDKTQLEEAGLTVEAAQQRLDRIHAAINEFRFQYGDPATQMHASSFHHHDALLRQYEVLLVEYDEAHRFSAKAMQDFCAVKKAAGLSTSLAQGAKHV